jgi:hypothetical protein
MLFQNSNRIIARLARAKNVQVQHTHTGTAGRLFLYFNLVIYPVYNYFLAFLHHTAFGNLNITMQPVILDDGKELSPSESDATCQATEDEDYYLNFVTFEVKG